MKIIAVIPAFNESVPIGRVVCDAAGHADEVIVVDDGSRDGTALNARLAGAVVVEHAINRGQGAALQTGVLAALDRGADVIVQFDADGQMNAQDIPQMVRELTAGGFDAVLGSRFLSKSTNMPVMRRAAKRLVLLVHWFLTGVRLSDVHCGFRVFRAPAARDIHITQDRMAHATEIEAEIGRLGLRYREVPVTVHYTPYAHRKSMPLLSHAWQVIRDLVVGKVVKKKI